MKTAMAQLYNELQEFKIVTDSLSITDVQIMISNYYPLERKQIVDTVENCNKLNEEKGFIPNGEVYYNTTFNNK